METIKTHLKTNSYSSVYLLYGSESYLKRIYRDKLKKGILGDDDDMNYSYFEGSGASAEDIMEIADTLPFFSEKRLIVIENSNFFKSQNPLADYMKEMPDTTHFIFIQDEIDKRNRLYKAIAKHGTTSKMDGLDEKNMMYWVASILKQNDKKITQNTIRYLLDHSGMDMEQLTREIEKLVCYAMERTVIEPSDIDQVCSVHISNEIFRMVDAVADGKQKTALTYYHNLLTLREKPMSILYLLVRQFNILLQILDMPSENNANMAAKIGIPPYFINKYRAQANRFTSNKLRQILKDCMDMEEGFKTGRIGETIAIELLIIQCTNR